jgi:hypothetical protein
MRSWFRLKTPQDLLAKLKAEAELLHQRSDDSYLAFNFFITAWHMVEWIHPGNSNAKHRENLRKSEPLLQVLSHIANGTKHFELDPQRHSAVSSTGGKPSWAQAPKFGRPLGSRAINAKVLYIILDGNAAKQLGDVISVSDLADMAVKYWENYLAKVKP